MVATARTHPQLKWLEEKGMTSSTAQGILAVLPGSQCPDPYLLYSDGVIDAFMSSLAAKKAGSEYIGKKGVPGFAWPDLSEHDANHDFIRSKLMPSRHARA